MKDKLAVPVPEACNRLSVGRTLFYELVNAGEIRTFKVGARTLVPVADLAAFVERKLQEVA